MMRQTIYIEPFIGYTVAAPGFELGKREGLLLM